MHSNWTEEGWRIVLVVLIGGITGLMVQELAWCLFLALLIYGLNSLRKLHLLTVWLQDPDPDRIPINFGVWGGVYARIQRMRAAHHQRESRLSRMLKQFRSSASALPDAAIALGRNGEIMWFNQLAAELFNLRHRQDIGQPFVNLFRVPAVVAFLERRDFEDKLEINLPRDRATHISIRIAPFGAGQMLLLAEDVTERVLAEQVRKDFVANVSHELRTPLTVIGGFAENLAHDEGLPEHMQRPIQLIEEQTHRMQSIVDDLLLLAKLESAQEEATFQPVDMAALLKDVIKDLQVGFDAPVTISLDLQGAGQLSGEAGALRSAINNLLLNAVKHTPEGSEVQVRWLQDERGCSIEVEDNGQGIAPEHIPRLTERFYRVDAGRSREAGGTGLGLAIVKHVLNAHNATLAIDSRVGRGTIFRCRFPAERCMPAGQDLQSPYL